METKPISIIERVCGILDANRMQGRSTRNIVCATISLDIAQGTAVVGAVRRCPSDLGYGIVATVSSHRGEDGIVHCCTVRAPSGRTERIAVARAMVAKWASETDYVHYSAPDDDRDIPAQRFLRTSQRATLAAALQAIEDQIARNAAPTTQGGAL